MLYFDFQQDTMKSWKMAIFPVMKTLVVPLMTNPLKLKPEAVKKSICVHLGEIFGGKITAVLNADGEKGIFFPIIY